MEDLNSFVAVVERGNFSNAARYLRLTPSAVSKTISRLEERLQVRLLNRTTRAVSLTEEGRIYYERARALLDEVADLERTVQDMQTEPTGTLRITATPTFGSSILLDVLHDYRKQYPDIRFDIDLSTEARDIVAGGIDIALREGGIADSRLVARKLTDTRFLACAPPGLFNEKNRPKNIREFFEHDSVLYINQRTEEIARSLFGDDVSLSDINLRMQLNNFNAQREAVKKGLGVSLLPCYFVQQDVKAGLIDVVPGLNIPNRPIYLVYPHRKHNSPKVRSFIDYILAYFEDVRREMEPTLRVVNG